MQFKVTRFLTFGLCNVSLFATHHHHLHMNFSDCGWRVDSVKKFSVFKL